MRASPCGSLLAAVERVVGKPVPVTEAPARPGDAAGAFANADKAREPAGLADRALPGRGDRVRAGLGREAQGRPGLRMTVRRAAPLLLAAALAAGCSAGGPDSAPPRASATPTVVPSPTAAAGRPLAGKVVVLDPGHQARQPPPRGGDRRARGRGRLREGVQHHRHGDHGRLPRVHLHLAGGAGRAAPAGGARRPGGPDPGLGLGPEVGSVRRRAWPGRQPRPSRPDGGPADQHPRRRGDRRRCERLPRDPARAARRVDRGHRAALAPAGERRARRPGGRAVPALVVPGGAGDRRPRRPRDPEPVRRTGGDGGDSATCATPRRPR
ncbi:hypothetical protein [Nocardioides convexus]|uniref:hypothetical protein n=1 Tax=Nocardioides convexus TaxID=2712224 RepID=UPI002418630C|nr:hypothetical protein [Nocardioides convexus]